MSSGHVKDSSFLGGRIPPEIESLSKNLKDVDQETFRKILKGNVDDLAVIACLEQLSSDLISLITDLFRCLYSMFICLNECYITDMKTCH